MIKLTIDGRRLEVEQGRTLLEACREFNIHIPTLCFHPALAPYGACRLCIMEVSLPPKPAKILAACVTPCQDGMVVLTNSEIVKKSRRLTVELLLAEDDQNPEIQKIAREMGVGEVRYKAPHRTACVLCGLCVRACSEIVGVSAISTIYRGFKKKVSPPFQIESETCIHCATCVLVCPTNAIKLEDISGFARIRKESTQVLTSGDLENDRLEYTALRARQMVSDNGRKLKAGLKPR